MIAKPKNEVYTVHDADALARRVLRYGSVLFLYEFPENAGAQIYVGLGVAPGGGVRLKIDDNSDILIAGCLNYGELGCFDLWDYLDFDSEKIKTELGLEYYTCSIEETEVELVRCVPFMIYRLWGEIFQLVQGMSEK